MRGLRRKRGHGVRWGRSNKLTAIVWKGSKSQRLKSQRSKSQRSKSQRSKSQISESQSLVWRYLIDGFCVLRLPLVHGALHVALDDVLGDVEQLGLGQQEGQEGVGDCAAAAHLHSAREGGGMEGCCGLSLCRKQWIYWRWLCKKWCVFTDVRRVCAHVCVYDYVQTFGNVNVCIHVNVYILMYVHLHLCTHVCTFICTYI